MKQGTRDRVPCDCGRCLDVGFIYEVVGGRDYVKACPCRAPAESRAEDPLQACRIPSGYRDFTLGNFRPQTPCLGEAYEEALAYCDRFPHAGAERGMGLLFWGGKGKERTHLAVGVLKELVANKGVSGRFWDFKALLREIARSYDPRTYTTEMTVLGSALETDLLVLDDLASERMTDWVNDTLFYIVNTRYSACRPTLITTVFEDVDRETALHADAMRRREFLIERIGQRTRSRLIGMCRVIAMQSPEERAADRQPSRPSTLRGLRRQSDT